MKNNKLTTEEKVLDYIVKSLEGESSNKLYICQKIIEEINIDEAAVIQSLYFLQSDKYIKILNPSSPINLDISCHIEVTSSGKYYFENKARQQEERKDRKIKIWIPIIISLVALIKSFSPEIALLWELLSK